MNGTTLATYGGLSSAFNTPQSTLRSTLLVRSAAGVTIPLIDLQNGETPTLCDGGQFSSAAPARLRLRTTIFARVEVTP